MLKVISRRIVALLTVVLSLISYSVVRSQAAEDKRDASSPVLDEVLVQSAPLYGILSELFRNESTVTTAVGAECLATGAQLLRGINSREIWALKALDASGAVRNAFVWGQRAWLGSDEQCAHLNRAPSLTLSAAIPKTMDDRLIATTAPSAMLYRMVFSNFSSRYQVDTLLNMHFVNRLGLCAPAACSAADIRSLAQSFWQQRRLHFQRLYDVEAAVLSVRALDARNFWRDPQVQWILGAILTIAIVVVALGTWRSDRPFVRCFSLSHSWTQLFAPANQKANTIGVISGVRTIVCFWVMLFHVIFYSMFTYDNLPAMFQRLESLAVQPLLAIVLYVDVFFVLSGCLLAYNFVSSPERMRTIRESSAPAVCGKFGQQLVHRYLRLTPVLLVALGLAHCVALYMREATEHHIGSEFDLFCTPSGWLHALFYAQNLYATVDMCTTWAWYVACDMQFYALMLAVLYAYARWPEAVVWAFGALVALVVSLCFGVMVHFELTPRIDVLLANLDVFYTPPWMRILPYMAGIAAGVLLAHLRRIKFTATQRYVRLFWLQFAVVCTISLFAMYFKTVPVWTFAAAFSVGRLVIALSWASAVLACALGMGGEVATWLGGRVFVHLDRLTYAMFVLNPVVVGALNAGRQPAEEHFDVMASITKVIGVWVLSYGAAVLMSPIFEMPFQRLSERYVLGRNK